MRANDDVDNVGQKRRLVEMHFDDDNNDYGDDGNDGVDNDDNGKGNGHFG